LLLSVIYDEKDKFEEDKLCLKFERHIAEEKYGKSIREFNENVN